MHSSRGLCHACRGGARRDSRLEARAPRHAGALAMLSARDVLAGLSRSAAAAILASASPPRGMSLGPSSLLSPPRRRRVPLSRRPSLVRFLSDRALLFSRRPLFPLCRSFLFGCSASSRGLVRFSSSPGLRTCTWWLLRLRASISPHPSRDTLCCATTAPPRVTVCVSSFLLSGAFHQRSACMLLSGCKLSHKYDSLESGTHISTSKLSDGVIQ